MPRGGARPGAGRPRKDPDALAKAEKPAAARAKGADLGRGLTMPDGCKSPDAPPGWPFGTQPAAAVPAPAATPAPVAPSEPGKVMTAREYLSALVNDLGQDEKLRLDAAKKLIEFEEAKPAALGKKAGRLVEAGKAASGKFAATAAPRLAAAGGRLVSKP